MTKYRVFILVLFPISTLTSCVQPKDKKTEVHKPQISNFTNSTENFKIEAGTVRFDTLPNNTTTHQIDPGTKRIFTYMRTGTTMIDASDWEAKYTETLIFQVDSTIRQFEYCDTTLKQINCKYFWICLTKDIKKEIKEVKKGCIRGKISNDSLLIEIDINPEFGFGGLMEEDEEKVIKYTFKNGK